MDREVLFLQKVDNRITWVIVVLTRFSCVLPLMNCSVQLCSVAGETFFVCKLIVNL